MGPSRPTNPPLTMAAKDPKPLRSAIGIDGWPRPSATASRISATPWPPARLAATKPSDPATRPPIAGTAMRHGTGSELKEARMSDWWKRSRSASLMAARKPMAKPPPSAPTPRMARK